MAKTGSLIQLHNHDNFEVLEELEDSDGKLYYKGVPIYTPVSKQLYNALTTLLDGLYVDGSCFLSRNQYDMLTKFNYENGELYYDGLIVSREYQDNAIYDMITALWDKINSEMPEDSETPSEPKQQYNFATYDNLYILTSDNQIFYVKEE